jgi:hypothetical protein
MLWPDLPGARWDNPYRSVQPFPGWENTCLHPGLAPGAINIVALRATIPRVETFPGNYMRILQLWWWVQQRGLSITNYISNQYQSALLSNKNGIFQFLPDNSEWWMMSDERWAMNYELWTMNYELRVMSRSMNDNLWNGYVQIKNSDS